MAIEEKRLAGFSRPKDEQAPLIVITGASQGIGAEIAQQFARADHRVRLALVARNIAKLKVVAEQCGLEERVVCYQCDVSVAEEVTSLKQLINEKQGVPSVLINNAGSWHGDPLEKMSALDFDKVIGNNLRSTFLMCRAFLAEMVSEGRGDIFNMASTAAYEGYADVSAYCAAKHGVLGLTRALREEVRGKNIRVCSISPGPTCSPSWDASSVDKSELMATQDIAKAFVQMYEMDRNVVVEEMILRPQQGHICS